MALQTITLDFTGKIAGSTTQNPNIAYFNDVEFTQLQYDQIFGSELRVATTDVLKFEFPVPTEAQINLQSVGIYYKSKLDSGENELRSSDKGVYNDDTTMYKQKLLEIYGVDIQDQTIKFNITTTGDYGVYEVKCDVTYDDAGLNIYGGQYQYNDTGGVVVTVPIQNKKLEEITAELESRPVNSVTNVTFAQVGTELVP
ncbi:hypothetical protein [Bacillus phage KonjoTrouble]|uniref:Uncharacterized protein n=2 Tax=Claudivirus konjotrouble TaxID=2843774 RepID=A0A514AAK4_9CAUD|nr:hypothetical protein H3013_gp07 [Bacillus phage KonjoTrouble]ASU04130.1 hypothetical protein [Bacillus phage KonjoTrouble]QDH50289.1 hypothetical protein VIOLETTEMAD_8 [Bacillus phage VioletteMad]